MDALQESRTVLSRRKKPFPGMIKNNLQIPERPLGSVGRFILWISGSTVGVCRCSYMESEASLV